MDGIKLLYLAIVKQTVKDYMESLKFLIKAKKNGVTRGRAICYAKRRLKGCRELFRSEGLEDLVPGIDGMKIQKALNKKVNDELSQEN